MSLVIIRQCGIFPKANNSEPNIRHQLEFHWRIGYGARRRARERQCRREREKKSLAASPPAAARWCPTHRFRLRWRTHCCYRHPCCMYLHSRQAKRRTPRSCACFAPSCTLGGRDGSSHSHHVAACRGTDDIAALVCTGRVPVPPLATTAHVDLGTTWGSGLVGESGH